MTTQIFSFHHFNPASGTTWKMTIDGETITAIDTVEIGKQPVPYRTAGLTVIVGKTPFTIGGTWRDIKSEDNFVKHELARMNVIVPLLEVEKAS